MPTEFPRLRKELLKRFAEELAPLGFKKSDQFYYRRTSYGKDIIHATFVSNPGRNFEIELSIGVRHDAVEEIIHEFAPPPEWLMSWTETIGNRLDNLLLDYNTIEDIITKHVSWTIANDDDLEKELQSIMQMVRNFILPYIERFSSLEEIVRVLSSENKESTKQDLFWGPWRAMHAIAAAFVLGDRNRFDEVIEQKKRFLSQISLPNAQMERDMPKLLAMIEELRRRWDEKEAYLTKECG
jgi:hypothetical protein